jgi:hypothetical protein
VYVCFAGAEGALTPSNATMASHEQSCNAYVFFLALCAAVMRRSALRADEQLAASSVRLRLAALFAFTFHV